MGRIKNLYWKYYTKINWRKNNKHNFTTLREINALNRVKVGKCTYGDINIYHNGRNVNLFIGNFCSIGPDVLFILNADHHMDHISTFPFKVKVCCTELCEADSKGNIIIDDDVWLSANSTIMSGVHIGQGAVVAAGAIVTKDVPPYAIVGGVPAKVIKYRFEPEMIEELLKVDYSKLTKEMIEEHIDDLYTELKNLDQLEWMPKKGCAIGEKKK